MADVWPSRLPVPCPADASITPCCPIAGCARGSCPVTGPATIRSISGENAGCR
jgi:hypothetical protein